VGIGDSSESRAWFPPSAYFAEFKSGNDDNSGFGDILLRLRVII
jgi:hypothetical protein